MKQKYLLLFAMLVCMTANMLGQSRTPGVSTTVQAKSAKLRSATGWKQNTLGVWIPNQNAISDIQLDEATRKSVSQNFLWIQLFSVRTPAQPYYVFLYENENYIAGIQTERRVNFFIMDGASYATFVNTVKNRNAETAVIYSSMYGYMSDSKEYSATALLNLINERIATPSKGQYVFILNAQRVDNADVVRFRLPEMRSEYRNNTLSDSYFESSWSNLDQIILATAAAFKKADEFDLGDPHVGVYAQSQPSTQGQPMVDIQTESLARPRTNVSVNEPVDDAQLSERRTSAIIEKQFISSGVSPKRPLVAEPTTLPIEDRVAERTGLEKPVISQAISTLSGIEEHYLSNRTGQWVTEKSPDFQFETVANYEIRTYQYKNTDYLLLTKNEQYVGASHILVRKSDYQDAMNELSTTSIIRIPVIAYSGIANTVADMSTIGEKAINKVADENTVIFKETRMIIQFKLSQEKNIARFYLYLEDCSRYGSASTSNNCQPQTSRRIKYNDANLLGTDQIFNKMYYETSYDSFVQFMQKPLLINTPKTMVGQPTSDF